MNQKATMQKKIQSSSDTFILVTGDTTVTGGNANTKVVFKNCALFKNCKTEMNEVFVDEADYIYIAIHM